MDICEVHEEDICSLKPASNIKAEPADVREEKSFSVNPASNFKSQPVDAHEGACSLQPANIICEPDDVHNNLCSPDLASSIKSEPADVREDLCLLNPAINIKSKPSNLHQDVCSLNLVSNIKSEPVDVHSDVCSLDLTSNIKSEPEDDRKVVAGGAVKRDIDCGPEVLQPADIHYMLQPSKPDSMREMPRTTNNIHTPELLDVDLFIETTPTVLCEDLRVPIKKPFDAETQAEALEMQAATTSHKGQVQRVKSLGVTGRRTTAEILKACIYTKVINENASNEQFKCEICCKIYNSKIDLVTHLNTPKPNCSLNVSNDNNSTISHINTNKRYASQHTKVSTSLNNLRNNIADKPYECSVCSKKSFHGRKLTGDTNDNMCSVCSMKLNFSSSLPEDEDKPYECSVCNHKFHISSNLTRHMWFHTGEKPYRCSVCNKNFKFNSNLIKHMGIHTGEKPYDCSVCNKKFKFSSHLKRHMKLHTNEKPYECSVCNKRFNHRSTLRNHARIHTGEKPYECSVCNKRFRVSRSLTIHMNTHKK